MTIQAQDLRDFLLGELVEGERWFKSGADLARFISAREGSRYRDKAPSLGALLSQVFRGERACPSWLRSEIMGAVRERCDEAGVDPGPILGRLRGFVAGLGGPRRRAQRSDHDPVRLLASTRRVVVLLTHPEDVQALHRVERFSATVADRFRRETLTLQVAIEQGDPDEEARIARRFLAGLHDKGRCEPSELTMWLRDAGIALAALRLYRLRFSGGLAVPMMWFDNERGSAREALVLPSALESHDLPVALSSQFVEKVRSRVVERTAVDEERGSRILES